MVGNFYVMFERWNKNLHATLKLIRSYGGWVNFRGISVHAWDMKTFVHMGKPVRVSVMSLVKQYSSLILLKQKSRLDPIIPGFILAYINIMDEDEKKLHIPNCGTKRWKMVFEKRSSNTWHVLKKSS